MFRVLIPVLLLAAPATGLAMADTQRHFPRNALEKEAAENFRNGLESVRCDSDHFIYGVGYIDGSYMERIFYVEGAGDRPVITVEFRGTGLQEPGEPSEKPGDIAAVPFIIELNAPRVRYATPSGDGWQVGGDGWETALRFKYTSWYGDIRRASGKWKVEWKGYRRPMLPDSVTDNRESICAMFAGR